MNKQRSKRVWDRAWRLAQDKGWSMEDFAQRIGMKNVQQLYTLKRGTAGIGDKILGKMAAALGISEESLMLGDQQRDAAAEEGKYQYELIPDEIWEIYKSDNQALKDVVTGYAASLLSRIKTMQLEKALLQGKTGATSDLKQPSQDLDQTVDEILAKAMNS